jgi:hypothetical protein
MARAMDQVVDHMQGPQDKKEKRISWKFHSIIDGKDQELSLQQRFLGRIEQKLEICASKR